MIFLNRMLSFNAISVELFGTLEALNSYGQMCARKQIPQHVGNEVGVYGNLVSTNNSFVHAKSIRTIIDDPQTEKNTRRPVPVSLQFQQIVRYLFQKTKTSKIYIKKTHRGLQESHDQKDCSG